MLVSLMTCASFFLYVNWRFTATHAPSPIITELMSQPLLRKLEVAAGPSESVHLSPTAFDPYQTAYRLQVPFEQLVVRVRAAPFSDEVIMQVEGGILEPDHWLNYTCGTGETMLILHLTTRDKARTLNSYTLLVTRQRPPSPPHVHALRVCQMYQDCELKVDEARGCGVERLSGSRLHTPNWEVYWNSRQHLPLCKNGFSADAHKSSLPPRLIADEKVLDLVSSCQLAQRHGVRRSEGERF
ncbi:uncharacterized protein LOC111266003 isoform X1 [Varroa jacobsoni]|uniref:uncharacterized protein LOC111266003 isoform X1 n=2 Tax=Varroa jacobsoni TaxID=62625 RepID=UPI000BF8AB3B|nr:uncharacterized protein LOC111266003 isoform X1 [Varroa jacobsoni]XP_022698845.1 uncharacterized protein LOC111266003 isoform X1 [Varroa jacobsoni]